MLAERSENVVLNALRRVQRLPELARGFFSIQPVSIPE
jgi:hypothetical protein